MREFTEQNRQRIRTLIEKITKRSIGKQNPKGFCFTTCLVLSIYLDSQDYSNNIFCGKMNSVDHFWIKLDDYDNIIIDATLKQFDHENNQKDSIYIGKKSENKITSQYKQNCISFNEWIDLYKIWCNPEVDQYGQPRKKDIVEKLISNNLISASILAYELDKLEHSVKSKVVKSNLYKLYFNPILKRLKNKWRTDDNLSKAVKSKAEVEFKFLLSKLD